MTVRACDEQGNPYFRENSLVTFKIEGNGEILAVDNGNLMGNEPYDETSIHMYHGQASVLIQYGDAKGNIRVSAYASGMKSASVLCGVRSENLHE